MEKRILAYRRFMDEKIAQLKEYRTHMDVSDGEDGSDSSDRGRDKENEIESGKDKREEFRQEIQKLKREHLVQVGFFQHERLIHLIVTVLFAVLEFLALMIVVLLQEPFSTLLPLVVIVLLVPYIRHYYILENEVQKMYGQYDELERMMEDDMFML